MSLVGIGLFVFGLTGISDTVKHLRKETQLQRAIIHHYRSGHGSEVRARAEVDLEKHRNAKRLHSKSVVVNVFSIVIGIGLNIPWAAGRAVSARE